MVHSSGDYKLVDGTVIAHGWPDLVDGELLRAVEIDETGQPHVAEPTFMLAVAVWSNTGFDGRPISDPGGMCNGWRDLHGDGALGNVHQRDTNWTDYGGWASCTDRAALYCVQQ